MSRLEGAGAESLSDDQLAAFRAECEALEPERGVIIGTSAGDPFAAAGVDPTEGPLAERRRREREGA